MTYRFTFPWPDKDLSPNARVYRLRRAELVAEARQAARLNVIDLLNAAGGNGYADPKASYEMAVYFYPPDNRKRDVDNMLSSCKATIDGMCDGLGINDRQIKRIVLEPRAKVAGGKVTIGLRKLESKKVG